MKNKSKSKLWKLTRWILLYPLLIPILYFIVAFILTWVPSNSDFNPSKGKHEIFISTNGVHLDLIIPRNEISQDLLEGVDQDNLTEYYAFGWGDENFYINTPTWDDLTAENAIRAMFLKSSTLIHVTSFETSQKDWIKIKCSESEFKDLQVYIQNSFELNVDDKKQILPNQGYSDSDEFYKANGSYSCFKTCNSWVNSGLKESGFKSCAWTPFDFGVMKKYKK